MSYSLRNFFIPSRKEELIYHIRKYYLDKDLPIEDSKYFRKKSKSQLVAIFKSIRQSQST